MTSQEAKEILLLYRPDVDGDEPEFAPALDVIRTDPELQHWFEHHCALQKAIFASFDQLAVPEGLKEQILSERKVRTNLPSRRAIIAMALACIAILFTMGTLMFYNVPANSAKTFDNFRLRMAGKVLRDYPKMDLETADLSQIRAYLAAHGGEKGYALPEGLAKTSGTGCATFDWHGKKVSMLCFSSGKHGSLKNPDLFLFITDASTVKVPEDKATSKIKQLSTVSWTNNDKTYLLAAAGDERFLQSYAP